MAKKTLEKKLDAENVMNAVPAAYEYYKGLAERIIYIDTEIDEELDSLRPVKQIIRWNMEDAGIIPSKRKPIYLLFYSYGGDANLCTATIDAIRASKTPIIGVNLGVAYSAAAYMYIACPTRYMFERASLLFHQGSAQFSGDFRTIMPAIQQYQAKVEKLAEIVKEFTNIPDDEVEESIIDEWYMYADEAVEKGAADYIIKDLNDIFNTDIRKKANAKRKAEDKAKAERRAAAAAEEEAASKETAEEESEN